MRQSFPAAIREGAGWRIFVVPASRHSSIKQSAPGPWHGRGDSDLDKATALAAAMVGSLGLAGPAPLLYLGQARG
jgi:hypothetical protein